ncbi:MAG TPA: Uma2 family endonuclease [Terriglobia bacterium]|nr:Uma2 family endonuclease [Terriglobia bacterium]
MQAKLLKAYNVGMPVDTRLTYEDLLALPDDGRRHEIINGEHFVTPSPLRKHQIVVIQLGRLMAEFLLERRLGEVYTAPFDVILSNHDVVQPDLMVVLNDRLKRMTERGVQGAPNLVIEVLSEATERRDRGEKLKLYAKYGVCEYWLVDPEAETIEVYSPSESLQPREHIRPPDTLKSPLLAGFSVPLRKVFHFER